MGQTAGNRANTEMGDIGKGIPIHKGKQKLWTLPRRENAHNAPDQQPDLLEQANGTGSEVQAQSQIPPEQLQMTQQTERGEGRGGARYKQGCKTYNKFTKRKLKRVQEDKE